MWDLSSFPDREHQEIRAVESNLEQLNRFLVNFKDAVSLFEYFARERERYSWCRIAARDGALTIFHFSKTMDSFSQWFHLCPRFRDEIDHGRLKQASKKHSEDFPGLEELRHSVGHAGELFTTPKAIEKNAIRPQMNVQIISSENIWRERYENTINGKLVSYEVSRASIMRMTETHDLFHSGFANVPRHRHFR